LPVEPLDRQPPAPSSPPSAVHAVENAEVARIFRELADLLEIDGANEFRVRAYRNAARVVEELPASVDAMVRSDAARLTELAGIGRDLAGKIADIVQTGTLDTLREIQQRMPKGVLALMHVPGLGPKRAKLLCDALGLESVADLERAAQQGRVRELKGFGAKTEQQILAELGARGTQAERTLRSTAAQYGETLLGYMRALPGVKRAEIAGSYRRCKETVGDLDLLVAGEAGATVAEHFVHYPEVRSVLAHGTTRSSVRLQSGLQIDLRVLPEESYGAALHYFTGSKAHNIAIRRLGMQKRLKISEYGVFAGKRRIGGSQEDDVFRAVGLPWIPPELREERGEIEAAREGRLPKLVELRDIRGDLQMHTTDSDGRDTLAAMAEAAEALGYEYIAITDHTPALRMVRGLDRAGYRRQMRHIDRLNAKMRKLTILKGAEVDILADGSLDLDDDTLAMFDVVLIAIHSKFDLSPAEQTRRVAAAMQHPHVDIFAHPTGRRIGRRRGAAFDWNEVFRIAADRGIMLEVNAQPERLDLDAGAARAAIERGIKLVISTDAHGVPELRFIRWGVDQARRGWAEKANVANAQPLSKLLKLLHRARER
jgi:DNA polymerase (family 10)